MPKVSVCIPTYNYARYIGQCIESVLAQTYEDWELIVVDNCSTDNTEEVVRSFRDPRIHFWRNERNLGLVRNWNRSVSLARGDYIGVLPADDLYVPEMLQRSVHFMEAHPNVGYTYSSFHVIDEDGRLLFTRRQSDTDRVIPGLECIRSTLLDGNFAIPPTVMMRRRCYDTLGGYDERFEFIIDWVLYTRAAFSHDVGYIAEPLASHRHQHATSVTARKFLKNPSSATDEEIRLLREIFRKVPDNEDWRPLRRKAFQRAVDRHLQKAYRLLNMGDATRFRTEVLYALSRDWRLPMRDRKTVAVFLGSLFGGRFAQWVDSLKRIPW